MMTKTFRVVLIGLALMLLFGLPMVWAGGKQEDEPAAASSSEDREKTPIEVYNPSFAYPTEKISLTLWDYYDERPDRIAYLKKQAKEFQKIHPNIDLTVVNIPWVGWKAKYLSAFQAGTGPDIATWDPPMAVPMGAVYPAPDWASKLIDEKYTDAAKKTMIFEGKYWGWPSQIDAGQMLYYNTTMYEEAGLDPDGPPETLPELLEAMKKTTKYDSQGTITQGGWAIRYFGDVPSIAGKFAPFLWTFYDCQNGYAFNDDYSDVPFEEPEYLEALTFYQKMVFEWKVASNQMPKPVEAFQLGLTAMTNRESFMVGHLKRESPDLEFKIAPLVNGAAPYGKFEVGTKLSAGQMMMVTTKEHLDVAWDVSLWLNNEEHDLVLAKMQGGMPTRKTSMNSEYVQKEIPYGKTAEILWSRPPARIEVDPWGIGSEVRHQLGAAVEAVIAGKADPGPALKEAAVNARAVIAKAKAAGM